MCLDESFESVVTESGQTVLTQRLRKYERLYFADTPPVAGLEIVDIPGPACYRADHVVIQINPAIASFPKICGILILHELIHNKLLHLKNNPDIAEGDRFQAEVRRLWCTGAYANLL